MKQKMLIVILLMSAGIYFTFPKHEESVYIYQGAVDITPIEVQIDGEVQLPGTYYFFEDTTVYDVIQMAGGLTDRADESNISYTKVINTNASITVSAIDDSDHENVILINVNEASFSELIDVPYISESMAAYIIMYREENGDFQTLDALINVKYIGAATLEKIRPYLKLS